MNHKIYAKACKRIECCLFHIFPGDGGRYNKRDKNQKLIPFLMNLIYELLSHTSV